MKLAKPFVERHPVVAAGIAFFAGPLLAMMYLGRGRAAILYALAEFAAQIVGLTIGIFFNFVGPNPFSAAVMGAAPVRLFGMVHAFMVARAQPGAIPSQWFARRSVVAGVYLAIVLLPGISAQVVRASWGETFEMKSAALAPTVVVGDRVFVSKRAYDSASPKAGDLIAYRSNDGVVFLRRVVSARADAIVVHQGDALSSDIVVRREAVVGRVSLIYWGASRQAWQWVPVD